MSIYFIPESPTKGFELSTLAHQLSPFIYINVHSVISVNPWSGFEWIELLKVSPHPMKWKFMDAYCGNKWSEFGWWCPPNCLLGYVAKLIACSQTPHPFFTNSSHPICQVARPTLLLLVKPPIPHLPACQNNFIIWTPRMWFKLLKIWNV